MRLRTRLFAWFLAAILLAAASSSLAVALMRPEPGKTPGPVMTRGIAGRLGRMWDDTRACDAYVETMRETTGFDFRLRRDPERLPPSVRRAVRPPGVIAFEGTQGAFIPVVRSGAVVGAVQFDASGEARGTGWWWRLAAALAVGAGVLAFAAERVARQIARPLEQVSEAAARFGAGDLGARARLDRGDDADADTDVAADAGDDEVHAVAAGFDDMADRVERVVRDQRELLGAVSHELRSPLGRARIALEIARDKAPEASASLDDVDRQLVELDSILGDLLAVARAGLTDLHTEPTDLVGWVRERVVDAGPIDLDVTPPDLAANARVDRALLGRALHNLLANARAHGHPAGEPLRVVVARAEGDPRQEPRVVVAVRDRGPGIADELLPTKLFEPFVRADPSRARAPAAASTGLGLALVRRIVEAHGGRAFARNVPGKGAEVGFELPLL